MTLTESQYLEALSIQRSKRRNIENMWKITNGTHDIINEHSPFDAANPFSAPNPFLGKGRKKNPFGL